MPVYTYRCSVGHEWDEVRSLSEDSQTSADPCPTCVEADPTVHPFGRKTVGQVSVKLGRGFTPTFYPNRDHK